VVTDLTGDGLPDLVVVQDECDDAALGRDAWKVFPGTPTGFGAEVDWPLPAGFHDWYGGVDDQPMDALAGGGWCDPLERRYSSYALLDLSGDGLQDLVWVQDECADPEVGRAQWTLFEADCAVP
jgi:hypothetical protein